MLCDRGNLHLVNLDLFFLGQVLQAKTTVSLSKPFYCATGEADVISVYEWSCTDDALL